MRTLEAAFMRMSSGRNKAITINIPVTKIEICGVLNLTFILLKNSGNRPSLPKANGYLDADIIPALAVETNARIAAILNRILPHTPMNTAAPSEIGVKEWSSSDAPSTPVVTKTTKI